MHDALKDMQIDLETRDLRPNTVATYLRCARKFIQEIGKPLGKVDREDVRQYLLTLRAHGKRAPTRNVALGAIRFLFCTTLRRPEVVAGIRRARTQPTVPVILSGSEMAHLLAAIRSVTYRAMVAILYGSGLRVSEMCALSATRTPRSLDGRVEPACRRTRRGRGGAIQTAPACEGRTQFVCEPAPRSREAW